MNEEEPVKTFGDFTERWWTVYMFFMDMLTELYREAVATLKELRKEIDLSWIDEVEDRLKREEEDLKYYAAA